MKMKMKIPRLPVLAGVLAVCACASSGLSEQQLVDTKETMAVTEAIGGTEHPGVALHLQYARDEIKIARHLMKDGNEEEADRMLDRAHADAEYALTLARTDRVRQNARNAWHEVEELRSSTNQPGEAR